MAKERLDLLITQRGLVETREQAQRLILAGRVRVAGQVASKPGHRFDDAVAVEIEAGDRFVSRGGDKLEAAFQEFQLDVRNLICLDVGASTGGFTDCLLQHGASKVFAVDVGKGQLHWKLRQDPRVIVLEEMNARYLTGAEFSAPPQFAVIDVSFISLTKVMPAVIRVLTGDAEVITLIKPQFEAGREQVQRGGVVRDESVRSQVVERIRGWGIKELALEWQGVCESPLRGPAGNVEFLAHWRKGAPTP